MSDIKHRFAPVPTLRTGQAHPHPEPIGGDTYSAVELMPGFRVVVLDQRKLPTIERYEFLTRVDEVADAIRNMLVRGAPAIGVCAAYGMVVAAVAEKGDGPAFLEAMSAADATLRAARPTAVNLAWALDRMKRITEEARSLEYAVRTERIASEARALHKAEIAACKAIGALGAPFVPENATILTHCNAGALATGGYGTALGIVRAAHEAGKKVRVLACETRPYLQGARLTAWELAKDQIPVEVITDSMAAHFMAKKAVDLVVAGADRIARNGDSANKIGTYGLACIAAAHEVPFYIAAPWSTVDLGCPNGDAIPIEERSERELSHFALPDGNSIQIVPDGVRVRNPSFDVTPHALITAIVTERGVVQPVSEGELAKLATQ
ncbi:MAG: Methylthioribose-phosphate isomerase [Labilithrix sp.]|jgi:methylthioribose-1-phosphate isomerase|nr:Methylthioribose-phosphate isomerase [Labilithrix sp.]